ncbi:MAG: apolipoprotein N-acyltransferase, partial [Deltaproteobacteria bacterium]|nr:apolipoprotein N-acyltransferase [Deltaproteobacteria bacterium]
MTTCLTAAAAAGALLTLAFPPARLHFTAWIAFVPLFWALGREKRPGWAALYGGAFGAAFFMIDLNWIYKTLITHGGFASITAVLVFVGMALLLALFPAAFGLVIGWFNARGMEPLPIAAFVWTGLEYVRSVALTGFPWDLVGYSQTDCGPLMQVADITGIYGVSFVILLSNVAVWGVTTAWISKGPIPWRLLLACVVVLIVALSYGAVRLKQYPPVENPADGFPIGILQGNIDQAVKWERGARDFTFLTYEKLGREAVSQGARLLVWPETSVPVLFGGDDPDWKRAGA